MVSPSPVARRVPNTLVEDTKYRHSCLCLGTRGDSDTWKKGCEGLGMETAAFVKSNLPTVAQVKQMLKAPADWVYLPGHWTSDRGLHNASRPFEAYEEQPINVQFLSDRVTVKIHGSTPFDVMRSSAEFGLKNAKVVVFGGCSLLGYGDHVNYVRSLFGNPLLLGFDGITGWKVCNLMLGGSNLTWMKGQDLFAASGAKFKDRKVVRDAWMNAAKIAYGAETAVNPSGDIFKAIDPDGVGWQVSVGKKPSIAEWEWDAK